MKYGRSAIPDADDLDGEPPGQPGGLFGLSLAEGLSRALAAEADLARVDEALSDPEMRQMWHGVAVWREALAAAKLDGALLDLEQLCRASRDPLSARHEFHPGVDAAAAASFAVEHELVREAPAPWIETALRRARFHTAGLYEREFDDLALSPRQVELSKEIGRLVPAPPLGARDARIGAVGMAAPALQILRLAAAIGDIESSRPGAERKERPPYAVGTVRVFDEETGTWRDQDYNIPYGTGTPAAGLQVGRLVLARAVAVGAGLKNTVPLLSPAFSKLAAAYEPAFEGKGWDAFWLAVIEETARIGLDRLSQIRSCRGRWEAKMGNRRKAAGAKARHMDAKARELISVLFRHPYVTARLLRELPGQKPMPSQTALDALAVLQADGVISDTNQAKSPRVYRANGVEIIP